MPGPGAGGNVGPMISRVRRDHLSSSEAALVVLQYQVLHEGSGTRAVDLEGGGSQGARLREPWLWGWCANVLGGLDATRRRMYAGWIPEVELLDVWQAEEIRRTERAVAALSRRLQERIESLEREFSAPMRASGRAVSNSARGSTT